MTAYKRQPPLLVEQLECKETKVISLVGGGGKTSTIGCLARELNGLGHKVVVTTTTRLGAEEALTYQHRLLTSRFGSGEKLTEQTLPDNHLLLVGSSLDKDKFTGVSPREVDRLQSLAPSRYLLVEADGAAKKPFKAPADHEPVIPGCTQLVIAVIGAWVIGLPLQREFVHRPALVAGLTGLDLNTPLTEEAIAKVVLHPEGYRKGLPAGARFAVLINGIDAATEEKARRLGRYLKDGAVDKILLTNVRQTPPVVEVIK